MTPGRRHRPGIVSLSLVGGKVKDVGSLPLLDLTNLTTDDVEGFLRQAGEVFAVHRGHDSGNTSAGVIVNSRRWFVKWGAEIGRAHV